MSKNFIAGAAVVDMYDGDLLIASARTLIDTSLSITSSKEEVRGGPGYMLFGNYYHTSAFGVTLTDTMFTLDYIAMQTGADISIGADIFTTEQVTLGVDGAGTLVGVPVNFSADLGLVGNVRSVNGSDWTTVPFVGQSFVYPNGVEGDVVCVKYRTNNSATKQAIIAANFIPKTIRLVMTGTLFTGEASSAKSGTVAGQFQVEIPRFQFDGNQEFSLTSSGVANSPLSGMALVTEQASCDSAGYYAIVTETLTGAQWYDNLLNITILDDEITLATSGTETLDVWAIPKSGQAFPVPNVGDLTFTSNDPAVVTVGANTGELTGVGAGSTTVSVVVTAKPEFKSVAAVTVG